jgi:flavodoxin
MKTLVVFYSRTGTTKKVAEKIAQNLNCDIEQITTSDNRMGITGYIKCGKEGMKGIPAKINPITKNPANYDLVIIGTPNWAGNMSSPIRTYLTENKDKFKKVAFFAIMGGENISKTFIEMEQIINQKPVLAEAIQTKQVAKGNIDDFVAKFTNF